MASSTETLHPSTTSKGNASINLDEESNQLERMLTISPDALKEITGKFVDELTAGLNSDGNDVPMNPTWVTKLPTGNETGTFLTVDLGGTNCRVCRVKLLGGGGKYELLQASNSIPSQLKSGTAHELWMFIATCVRHFTESYKIPIEELRTTPLGFTFSYPVTQTSIKSGTLQRWTKGFDVADVEGRDVVAELQAVFSREGLPIQLCALINDTTGTLIASSYADPETKIGTIFGTGSNAAYMERCSNIPKLSRDGVSQDGYMAINCEYGAFDNKSRVLPFTAYDKQIDRDSPRPGQQRYEKLVAGYYLGEIYRLVILDIQERGRTLFGNQDISRLREPYILDCAFLETVENDPSATLEGCKALFNERLSLSVETAELYFCRHLARLIGQRAARLYACGIAAILKKTSLQGCHVAVDGSVFNKYRQFHDHVMQALADIFDWPPENKPFPVRLVPAVDGSGVGAAVICALNSAV